MGLQPDGAGSIVTGMLGSGTGGPSLSVGVRASPVHQASPARWFMAPKSTKGKCVGTQTGNRPSGFSGLKQQQGQSAERGHLHLLMGTGVGREMEKNSQPSSIVGFRRTRFSVLICHSFHLVPVLRGVHSSLGLRSSSKKNSLVFFTMSTSLSTWPC